MCSIFGFPYLAIDNIRQQERNIFVNSDVQQWFSNSKTPVNHLRFLLNGDPGSVSLGKILRFCISNKHPGNDKHVSNLPDGKGMYEPKDSKNIF